MSDVDSEQRHRRGIFLQLILLGLLIAIVLASVVAVWNSRSRSSEVVALLNVGMRGGTAASAGDPRQTQITQRTQLAYLNSPAVMQKVVQNPRVATSAWLMAKPDPVFWLLENVDERFVNNSEILMITLNVPRVHGDDGAAILDSIIHAYFEAIAENDEGLSPSEALAKLPFEVRLIQPATIVAE